MAILPIPSSSVTLIDPVTGGISVQWQNFFQSLGTITGTYAPTDARYWVSTSDSSLTNEQNLGSLTTGYMKLTVAAGIATPSTVTTIPGGDITGAALTKADDTNVTLTLGGTPASALLKAASLTLGWTGTLAVARGGIGVGTLAAHGVLVGNGTSAVSVTGTGTSGQVLISNGASADPTFQTFTGTSFAVYSAKPTNPTGTSSGSAVMMGLAGSITPAVTGRLVITMNGNYANNTLGGGTFIQLRYGTGSAPTNGAAATGTTLGAEISNSQDVANDNNVFSLTGLVTGLSVGTAYWLDLGLRVSTGASNMTNITITAFEI
jgi:hypothetical protein